MHVRPLAGGCENYQVFLRVECGSWMTDFLPDEYQQNELSEEKFFGLGNDSILGTTHNRQVLG